MVSPSSKQSSNEDKAVDGLCGICPAGCWVRIRLNNGKMQKVEALPEHPLGMICTIGKHSPQIVQDPDRLKYPMRRVGPKGAYDFERISWDEAMDTIAERLQAVKKEFGPEATAIYTGRGSFELSMCDIYQPKGVAVSSASSVLFPFGSPNTLGVGALCYVSFAMIAPHVTMGEMLITMDTEIEQAELIVVWGANPATDSPPLAHQQILRARERGAEVVVIDPRRSETAKEAGAEWIPIRPGTDGALALGMINVLIDEEVFDEDFAENWAVGFDELKQYVQHFRPEAVEQITGVTPETVKTLARRIARAHGACPIMYTGLEYSDSGVQAIRAVLCLWALAGQLDVPGGLVFRMKENIFPVNKSGLISNPNVKKALGRDRFPVYSMYRGESHAIALPESVLEGKPYKIRALLVLGASIITAWPQPAIWRKTLNALDFLVCMDRYLTADAGYADIVLPATTMYEITSYMTYGPLFKIRERIIEPLGEARNDYLVIAELAKRLGYGHLYPQSEEDLLRHALQGSGYTLEQVQSAGGEVRLPAVMMQYKKWMKGVLRPDGKPGFNTPSGKFEIASSILSEHGYDALPIYTEPGEGPLANPRLAEEYPLVFNSGARVYSDFRSQHHGVSGLKEMIPDPIVTMNTKDAGERGIRNGDWVEVKTFRGKATFKAVVTDDIISGTIDACMGGGGPLGSKSWQKCNVNELTDLTRYDPISGFPVYKTLLAEVTKLKSRKPSGKISDRSATGEKKKPQPQKKLEIRHVYFDHNATTPVAAEVVQKMLPYLRESYGNPSSIHQRGAEARDAVESGRRKAAQLLNCTARRIIFTSGGSEADNLAIKGLAFARREQGDHIITTKIEHPAVLNACRALEQMGFAVTYLDVDSNGMVQPRQLREAIRRETILVSIMLANNEIGTIQPVAELADIAHKRGAVFHCDAVQGIGKIEVDVEKLGVDLLSVSGHKLHGPKGVGMLYVRKGISLIPLISGGSQERRLRAGTENVPGIVGFGKACELAAQRLNEKDMERVAKLRDLLEAGIRELVPGARLNGDPTKRLPNTLNVTLPELRGESLVMFLSRRGVYCSSGSACKSGNPEPSHTLLAIGLSAEDAHCALRFSLGHGNDEADVKYMLHVLGEIIRDSRSSVRFAACR
jgi:cysteine desulfurase NifS